MPVEKVEDQCDPAAADEEDSGFCVRRKDSERRATLHRILTEDKDRVVANLMEALAQVTLTSPVNHLPFSPRESSNEM